jgi:hypothetical protein
MPKFRRPGKPHLDKIRAGMDDASKRLRAGKPETSSDLSTYKKHFKFNPIKEIKARLKRGEGVVFLDRGCGNPPTVLKTLAETFGDEITEGMLELHGTHLMADVGEKPTDWQRFKDLHSDLPVNFHRRVPGRRVGEDVKADIVLDHFGDNFHSANPVGGAQGVKDKTLKEGGIFLFTPRSEKTTARVLHDELVAMGAEKTHDSRIWHKRLGERFKYPVYRIRK